MLKSFRTVKLENGIHKFLPRLKTYWLTPTGLNTWKKNVDSIIQLDRPKTLKHLRDFLGEVNYYRDMCPRRAHVLKPLTDKYGTKTFVWTNEMENNLRK